MNFLLPLFLLTSSVTAIDQSAWADVINNITAQISVTSVVGVLAALVGACIGLVFMWWGVRKMASAIMSAFKKGKLRI